MAKRKAVATATVRGIDHQPPLNRVDRARLADYERQEKLIDDQHKEIVRLKDQIAAADLLANSSREATTQACDRALRVAQRDAEYYQSAFFAAVRFKCESCMSRDAIEAELRSARRTLVSERAVHEGWKREHGL